MKLGNNFSFDENLGLFPLIKNRRSGEERGRKPPGESPSEDNLKSGATKIESNGRLILFTPIFPFFHH